MMLDESDQPLEAVSPSSVAPEDVRTAEVRAALDSPDPVVRRNGCRVCATLAAEDVDAVHPLVPDLGTALGDDSLAVVRTSLSALTQLARQDPAGLEPCLGDLIDAADASLSGVALEAARCLSAVATEQPETCVPYVERLVAVIESLDDLTAQSTHADAVENPETRRAVRTQEREEHRDAVAARQSLANVVVAAAEAAPGALHDRTHEFARLLSDDDPVVVGSGLAALSAVAKDDPAAVAVDDRLFDCLDHENASVRARAIQTLGFLGADSAVPALRRIADEEDGDVAALAAETADFLAQ